MKPDSTTPYARGPVGPALIVLASAGAMGIASVALPAGELRALLLPTLAALLVFLSFTMVLRSRVGANFFGDLGFLYMGLALAYTVYPAAILIIGHEETELLELLLPTSAELGLQLWRHVLFMFAVGTGYLVARGHEVPQITLAPSERADGRTVALLIAAIVICILCLSLLSAPVHTYAENYTRYDHLPWLARKFVSVCLRLKLGLYLVLITFLFLDHRRYRTTIPVVVMLICLHEFTYSLGARIESLIVLLGVTCLYTYLVKPITWKAGLVTCIALLALFSVVEVLRFADGNVSDLEVKPAGELGAVYLPGFHLYSERAQGSLPPREWPMLFSDFVAVLPFGDFSRWNPMDWYTRNYFPEAEVAPLTLGPIADSALWGGELDLLLRGLINGLFFAYLVRWFLRHRDRWWGVAVYVYCYATCIMTLKYGVFYHLAPLLKTVAPTLLLVGVVRRACSQHPDPGPVPGSCSP
jgi:hypothetical protein